MVSLVIDEASPSRGNSGVGEASLTRPQSLASLVATCPPRLRSPAPCMAHAPMQSAPRPFDHRAFARGKQLGIPTFLPHANSMLTRHRASADRRVSPLRAASLTRPPDAIHLQPVSSPVVSAAAPARALEPRPSPGLSPQQAAPSKRDARAGRTPAQADRSPQLGSTSQSASCPCPQAGAIPRDDARRSRDDARRSGVALPSRQPLQVVTQPMPPKIVPSSRDAPCGDASRPIPPPPGSPPQAGTHPGRLRHGSGSRSPHSSHRPMTSRPSQVAPRPKPGPPPAGRPSRAAPRPKPGPPPASRFPRAAPRPGSRHHRSCAAPQTWAALTARTPGAPPQAIVGNASNYVSIA